jgi:hypothetical protein
VSSKTVGALRLSACGSALENLAQTDRLDGSPVVLEAIRTIGESPLSAFTEPRNPGLAA